MNTFQSMQVARMMGPIERIQMLRKAGYVRRLHTVRVLHAHNIAEHVYGALCIARELCAANEIEPEIELEIMRTVLYHDAAEVYTGDVPAPTKRLNDAMTAGLREMEGKFEARVGVHATSLEKGSVGYAIFKASDWLDLGFFCIDEMKLGSREDEIREVLKTILEYVAIPDIRQLNGVSKIVEHLRSEWERYGYRV